MNPLGQSLLQVSSFVTSSLRKKIMLTSCIVRVSKDGRDLGVISEKHRIVFIRDFERICRGESTFEQAGLVLGIQPKLKCCGFGFFKDGRVCVITVRISQASLVNSRIYVDFQIQGLYIFTFGPDLSAKAAFVRTPKLSDTYPRGCIQLTNHRIYFTWQDSTRRQNIPLFEDAENVQGLPPPITPIFDADLKALLKFGQQQWESSGYTFNKWVLLSADSDMVFVFVVRPVWQLSRLH